MYLNLWIENINTEASEILGISVQGVHKKLKSKRIYKKQENSFILTTRGYCFI